MRHVVLPFLWLLAAQAAAIGGCNEVTSSDTAPLTLYLASIDEPRADPVPLEGAQLCQTDTTNCDLSDMTGEATIELPLGETSFTVVAEGHVSVLVPVVMPHFDDDLSIYTDDRMEAELGRLMIDYPMVDTGAILVTRYDYSAGATFELESAAAVGPFYEDGDGWWSLDLTETTDAGRGGFAEVPPGDRYTIRAGGTARDCSASWGWPGEDEDSYILPVRENYLTYIVLFCFP